ncbi:MAG: PEP-CTERM sorting domain-containing protein [Nannocystaceae bacterium]|nr:PEP-CTERM sorting domain-containing protein [Nannocystaceae bacterium]
MQTVKTIGTIVAALSLTLGAAPSANATVIFSDTTMASTTPGAPDTLEHFVNGYTIEDTLAAQSDGNTFAGYTQAGQFTFAGNSSHVNTFPTLAIGNVLRMSTWVMQDPSNSPTWTDPDIMILKMEFYDAFGGTRLLDTEIDAAKSTSFKGVTNDLGWTQVVFEYEVNAFDLPVPSAIGEIRPVMFVGDFTSAGPEGGRMFLDNISVELYTNLADAAANDPLLINPTPGGFDLANLAGDINGDGFVGIADLNIVLGTWNNGTLPPAGNATIPEPASMALLGLGGLTLLKRRR